MNFNVDISGNELVNGMLKLIPGEDDSKIIIAIVIVIIMVWGLPIFKYAMTTRERRQHEKIADKAMLGWIKTGKKEKTYIDMLLHQYGIWTIICFICLFLYLLIYLNCSFKFNDLIAHIISKLAHFLFSYIYGRYLWKSVKIKECMKHKKKHKIIASVSIYFIFFILFHLVTIERLFVLFEILFWVMIITWSVFILSDWESKYIYENKYVTVNTKEFGTIENVQAWNIKNYKGWISLSVCKKGEIQEKRIKKEDIIGATYYGKPVIVTSNVKFFTTYNTLVEDQK